MSESTRSASQAPRRVTTQYLARSLAGALPLAKLGIPAFTAIALYAAVSLFSAPQPLDEAEGETRGESRGETQAAASGMPPAALTASLTASLTAPNSQFALLYGARDTGLIAQSYSEDVYSQLFDEQGQLTYTLEAQAQAQLDDSVVLIRTPHIVLFEDGVENWRITAQFGEATRDDLEGDSIVLVDDAQLNAAPANDSRLQLRSPRFTLDPERETLASNEAVSLIEAGLVQTAVGFDADLQADTIRFRADVQGRFETNP